MRPLCVLLAGEPVLPARRRRGSFGALIRHAAGSAWTGPWWEVDCRTEALPDRGSVAGFIVTGSAASVTERAAWMLRMEEYLATAVRNRSPVLGICFGHQMLSQALGGEVQKNPRGREMGTVTLQLITADDPLLPRAASPQLVVNMSHVDSALRLPADAQLLATTEREPHAAARFGECAWGIQFHPEFDDQVMCDYIQDRSRFLRESGVDPEALAASVQDTPDSREVLARFIRLFARG